MWTPRASLPQPFARRAGFSNPSPSLFARLGGSVPRSGSSASRSREPGPPVSTDGPKFADWRREIVPSIQGRPEIAWVPAARAHGRGFATEATLAAITWGESHLGALRSVCLIHPENASSLRVAEKCGYRETGRSIYKDYPVIMLDRPFGTGSRPRFNPE